MPTLPDLLGSGFEYPIAWDPGMGGPTFAAKVNSVRASLRRLLDTAPGEQLMVPEYGCQLKLLVFERDTEELRALAETVILDAITRWEPRVQQVLSLDVSVDDAFPNSLFISMVLLLVNSQEQVPFDYSVTTAI